MAEKIEAVPENKKPPIYEISPKWIIIYQVANFVAVLFVVFYICAYKNGLPFLCYFLFQFLSITIQFFSTVNEPATDISRTCYHPDLMSWEKISYLRKLCTKAKEDKFDFEIKGKLLPADFVVESHYRSLIDAQKELHVQCWFLTWIGTPKVQVEERKADISDKEQIYIEGVKQSQESTSKNDTEIPVKLNPDSIDKIDNKSDEDLKFALSDINSKLSFIADKLSTECNKSDHLKILDKNDIMKSDIKNLKAEIAELKFEFLKLQKTLESVVASKNVF